MIVHEMSNVISRYVEKCYNFKYAHVPAVGREWRIRNNDKIVNIIRKKL